MGQSGWVYLGTKLPRLLNVDRDYVQFERYVQRGEGRLAGVRKALHVRYRTEGKPLFISEENLSIGAFEGYPSGHAMAQSRAAKLQRLADVLEGWDAVLLVSLRPFRSAVFSAYVEYQEQFSKANQHPADLVRRSDVMGMYRYDELRSELESLWPGGVQALDFFDIVSGKVVFPGFSWQASEPMPNTRQHRKVDGGVMREVVTRRPFLPLAKRIAVWSSRLAVWLWSQKSSHEVRVDRWDDEVWSELQDVEASSERARRAWLGISDPS